MTPTPQPKPEPTLQDVLDQLTILGTELDEVKRNQDEMLPNQHGVKRSQDEMQRNQQSNRANSSKTAPGMW